MTEQRPLTTGDLDRALEPIVNEMRRGFQAVDRQFDGVNDRLDGVNGRIGTGEARTEKQGERLAACEADMREVATKVRVLNREVFDRRLTAPTTSEGGSARSDGESIKADIRISPRVWTAIVAGAAALWALAKTRGWL